MAREYPEYPRVGVGVVVWRGEEMLLVRRGKPPRAGQWSLPGGAQELGETVAETARREVLEETGVTIRVNDVITAVDLIEHDEAGRVRYHYVLVDMNGEWIAGEARPASDVAETTWVALDDLERHELWAETRRVIALATQSRALTGDR